MKKVFYLLIIVVFGNNIYANNKLKSISILQKKNISSIEYVFKIIESSELYKNSLKDFNEFKINNKNGDNYKFDFMVISTPKLNRNGKALEDGYYEVKLISSNAQKISTIAWFIFDSKKRQLLNYNIVFDQKEPIEFDKSLLSYFYDNCYEK